jgi:hypothetical protein
MTGGRSPGRTLEPVVAGPVRLDDGLAVGEAVGPEVAENVDRGVECLPQAAATNVTTTSRALTPIRIRKSCLIRPTPHPRSEQSVDSS